MSGTAPTDSKAVKKKSVKKKGTKKMVAKKKTVKNKTVKKNDSQKTNGIITGENERNENRPAVHHFGGDRLFGYAGMGIFAAGGYYSPGKSQEPDIRTGSPENMRRVLSWQREKGMAPCRILQ